jgi:hypothetical protein
VLYFRPALSKLALSISRVGGVGRGSRFSLISRVRTTMRFRMASRARSVIGIVESVEVVSRTSSVIGLLELDVSRPVLFLEGMLHSVGVVGVVPLAKHLNLYVCVFECA